MRAHGPAMQSAQLPGQNLTRRVCWRQPFQPSCQARREAKTLSFTETTVPAAACNKRTTLSLALTYLFLRPAGAAYANILQDYVERSQRPEMTPEQALVKLLDARGTLYELKALAATPSDSSERFHARALLPGMAKSLRQVGQAAPVLVAQVTGSDKRATISREYGGGGDSAAIATPVYVAIGQIITISGRTIRKEAQAEPELARNAIGRINELLAMLPNDEIERAQEMRKARRAGLTIKQKSVPMNAIAS